MNDLGKALLSKVDDIIEVWIAEVRHDIEIESNRGMTHEAIHNGLPDVLASVATMLTAAFSNEAAELEEGALEHGTVRADQGFDVAEVAREYRILRRIVVDALEPDLQTGTVAEVIKAMRQINDVLDSVVTLSMDCYVERRMASLDQMHGQLLLTNQELTRLVAIQKDNVSHLAHELKNPLNSIISFSSILLRKQQKQLTSAETMPMEIQQMERILNNGHQLLRLINNTLEASRNESNQLPIKIDAVAVPELVRAVVEAFDQGLDEKPIEMSWNCDRAPLSVMSDGLRLQQILTNLVSNAIRYTDEGSISITCYVENEQWAMAVSDTGRGLSPEQQQRIFEPYFRAGDKGDYLPESSGLGLTIVEKLVGLLQGEIQVASVLGEGSTFTVLLPLVLG